MTDLHSESSGLGCTHHAMRMVVEAVEPPVDATASASFSLDAEMLWGSARLAATLPKNLLVSRSSPQGLAVGGFCSLMMTLRVTLGC